MLEALMLGIYWTVVFAGFRRRYVSRLFALTEHHRGGGGGGGKISSGRPERDGAFIIAGRSSLPPLVGGSVGPYLYHDSLPNPTGINKIACSLFPTPNPGGSGSGAENRTFQSMGWFIILSKESEGLTKGSFQTFVGAKIHGVRRRELKRANHHAITAAYYTLRGIRRERRRRVLRRRSVLFPPWSWTSR